jgi:hypothetical protein
MADRPRTFEEVVAATDPEEIARLNRGEKYQDQAVRDPFQREVVVFEDRYGNGEWRVEYNDDDGGCYVTVFGGPVAGTGILRRTEDWAATHRPRDDDSPDNCRRCWARLGARSLCRMGGHGAEAKFEPGW